ncbi:MAG: hypothetical protein JXA10_12200 [Anaerolineae bacterium]|nr:hypothetical protein [Anaerolineae bacterium]
MFRVSRIACICFLVVGLVSLSSGIAAGQSDEGRPPLNAENAGELALLLTLEISGSDYFSPDGHYLLIAGETDVALYDMLLPAESAEPVALWTDVKYGNFSYDGRFLTLTNTTAAQLEVIDLSTISASSEPAIRIDYPGDRPSHLFSQDNTRLFVKTGGPLRWYDLTGDLATATANELGTDVTAFTLSPDNLHVAVIDSGGVMMFDLTTGEAVFTHALESGSLTISPGGTYLHITSQWCRVGGCSGSIEVYDWSTNELRLTVPIEGYVDRLVYSPDDTLAIYATNSTGSWSVYPNQGTTFYDAVVHVVDMATGEDVFTIQETDAVLTAMYFTADSSRVAYSSIIMQGQWPDWSSSVIHIVDLATEEATTIMAGGLIGALSDDWSVLRTTKGIYLPGTWTSGTGSAIAEVATGTTVIDLANAYAVNNDLTLVVMADAADSTTMTVYTIMGDALTTLAVEMDGVEAISSLSFSTIGNLIRAKFSVGESDYIAIWGLPG